MSNLTLSLIQTSLYWQEPELNRSHFSNKLSALAAPSDVIVLPEMFSTGFSMQVQDLAEGTDGETLGWMLAQAQKHNSAITGSIIVNDDGQFYNRLYWVQPDGLVRHYDKRHLFRMAREHHHFSAGSDKLTVQWRDWRISPFICYDLRFPVWSRCNGDIDLLLYVANWPAARSNVWRTLLPARAMENLCYVAGVNRIGDDGNNVPYQGDSLVCDFKGAVIGSALKEDCSIQVQLQKHDLQQFREKFPAHLDADQFNIITSGDD